MAQKITKLQVGIYVGVIFITLIVVFIFMGVIPGLRENTARTGIVMWGTYPEEVFQPVLQELRKEHSDILVAYVQQNPNTLADTLTEAIATGGSPDLVLLPDQFLHLTRNKLTPVPSLFLTEREFFETYIGVTTSMFSQGGIMYGVPFAVDPMILYWNRDFFASEAIAQPPTTWDTFLETAKQLTQRTPDGNLTRAGAAMGLSSNIPRAEDIVLLLTLQGGTSVIDPQTHVVSLGEQRVQQGIRRSPTESALVYFSDFARREKTSYTWNHTFPNPIDAFVREDLAMFIGRASDFAALTQRAPHIPIGVSPVPQYRETNIKTNYARSFAFVVPAASRKQSAAWRAATFFSEPEIALFIANSLWLAPARRDVLAEGHEFPPFSVFYEETLRSRTWYDPNPPRSANILETMIESVAGGRNPGSAAIEARARLEDLL